MQTSIDSGLDTLSFRRGEVRFLIINSSAYHGNNVPQDGTPEFEHGRLATRTLEAIRNALIGKGKMNIALCHHHPVPHEDYSSGATDIMQGGAELVKLLASGDYGEWLIVHGHKHMPKLSYSQAMTSTPSVIFAAGSFSAKIHHEIAAVARNQFYIVQLDAAQIEAYGLVRTFSTWDWTQGDGWNAAQINSGLPHKGGFGYRERPQIIARDIFKLFGTELQLKWTEVIAQIPKLAFLTPHDLQLTMAELTNALGVTSHVTATGAILQLDRTGAP